MHSLLIALDVLPEGVELVGPECLDLRQPRLEVGKRLRPQPVDADASVVLAELLLYQPAPTQHPQVPAHGGTAQGGGSGELAGTARPFPQQLHHVASGGLGKRRERSVEIIYHQVQ